MFRRISDNFAGPVVLPVILLACLTAGSLAQDAKALLEPLPLSPTGQPVPGYPAGAPARAPDTLRLTPQDIERLKAGKFRAGIAMQAIDTPWNSLQVQAITETLARYGIEVVAVTDASQDPVRQAGHLRGMIDRKVDVIFSVPIDPATQTAAYKRVADAGIKIVFMDNVVHNLRPGKDYVTVVASDNEKNAIFASEELFKAMGGKGEVGLITFSFESYYSIAARKAGFEKTLAAFPGIKLAATERFTQPSEVYNKTLAMLTANPNIKGIFAVWGDPAMQAVAAARALGRKDVIVTTVDLGPDTALYIARGEILAIGAQLPYDLGIAEANAAAYALLGKPVPPYISLPALRVKKENLLSALEMVTKQPPPDELKRLCANACK